MQLDTVDVYLGLGANLGDRRATLSLARERLAGVLQDIRCSRLYETPPWGVEQQPRFLNAVCCGRTTLAPPELLVYLKSLERELGRVPTAHWGPRVIDVDILLFDDLVYATADLTIPHPRLHERAFVLVPLLELAPALRHPALGTPLATYVAGLSTTDIVCVSDSW